MRVAVHVGVNAPDRSRFPLYQRLMGCENDACAMASMSRLRDFDDVVLLTESVTVEAFAERILDAVARLNAGDTLFLTYSGHGYYLRDPSDPDTGLDQTWIFYDGIVTDKALLRVWRTCRTGVRVLVISDSCHSGSIIQQCLTSSSVVGPSGVVAVAAVKELPVTLGAPVFKVLPGMEAIAPSGGAQVLLLPACADTESTLGASTAGGNSVFTEAILSVWDNGGFSASYGDLMAAVQNRLPHQTTLPRAWGDGAAALKECRAFAFW